jgi:hypothetical protein
MTPYGCHNRSMPETVRYQDGWTEDGRRIMVEVPFRMSHKCFWEFRETDPRCEHCNVPRTDA